MFKNLFITLFLFNVLSAEIIEETGSLKEFFSGSQGGIAYDNYISHISEGIVDTGYNDYGPGWLDNQTNGFGNYTIIPQDSPTIQAWNDILNYFIQEEYLEVDAILTDSLDSFQYDLVIFQDSVLTRTFYMLRERIDSSYVDNNGTGIPEDDVIGSFHNGWGLYILNPNAQNKNLIIQVPHPCDDFLSPYLGMELFIQCDAYAFQVAGAGREVMWSESGTYNNNQSLSDPSRNENSVFHQFHKVVTDSLENNSPHSPVVLQVHSFDNESHQNILCSVVLSGGYDAGNANKPIRDVTDSHFDFINFTDEYPIESGMYGEHPDLHVTYYYQVHYDGSFFYVSDSSSYSIPHTYELLGINTNRQLLDLHNGFNHGSVFEPFVHIELDEKPLLFDGLDLSMEDLLFQGMLPVTWRNYENYLVYYQPFVDAVKSYFDHWNTVPDTTAPPEVSSLSLTNTTGNYVDLTWDHVKDTNFKTYRIYYDTTPEMTNFTIWDSDYDGNLLDMFHNSTRITNLNSESSYFFRIESEDHFENVSELSDVIMATTLDPVSLNNFDTALDSLGSWDQQDMDPSYWLYSDSITFEQSPFSLFLYGNTWKTIEIDPLQIMSGQVWQIAVHSDGISEIQGFGLSDSVNTLFYSFAGSQELDIEEWIPVYQGNYPNDQWNLYQLPIADDWYAWYDHFPLIKELVFINDADNDNPGHVFFDNLVDLTNVLPLAPQVFIEYEIGNIYRSNSLRQVDIQFYSDVIDPDTYSHTYYWSFGDGATATEANPLHTFTIEDDHTYTVFVEVRDQTERSGYATVQIEVDEGESSFPLTMNFVGDIILARNYENDGGIIPTLGVEAIFEPTLALLGQNADITVANLEAPLTLSETVHPTKPIVFKGAPENVSGLVFAGIDIVTLANNHVMDYMLPGLEDTQNILSDNNILHSGAGANSTEAYQPIFIQKKGVNIAFLASSDRTGQYNNYQPYLNAGFNKPGFAYMTPYYILQQIESVQDVADLIVVEMHAGSEYSTAPGYEYDSYSNSKNPTDFFSHDRDNFQDEILEDEEYSPYLDIPHMWDREIRHFAIDSGADIVIVHHPHIIQGIEIYNGKLIAHSLGNFVFDLSYPETFPSMILQSKIDGSGFYEFTLDPIIIDDYIPAPALGQLGLHILDDIANKSKALSTTLHINRQTVQAHVIIDTLLMPATTVYNFGSIPLIENDSSWISSPVYLNRNGFISGVVSDSNLSSLEYRLGKEKVWMGNMEDEGFTFWNVNSSWEYFDDSVAFRGERSIGQIREAGMGDNVVTNFEKRLLVNSDKKYSIHGWIKTNNGANVTLEIRCYSSRTGGNILATESVTHINGETDWNYNHKDVTLTENTKFIDYRLNSDVPEEETAYSWFDNVGLIEWDDWKNIMEEDIDSPNNFSYIQFKNPDTLLGVNFQYVETVYDNLTIPNPEFTSNVTEGELPLGVQFNDLSTGVITYREWDFGDGNTSNEINPFHEYAAPGEYTVTLAVPDYDGDLVFMTKEDYIQVADSAFIQVWYIDDWNLVGLPSIVLNEHVEIIYPEAIAQTLFRFDESYFLDSLLEAGSGYWLRFENGGEQQIQGTPLESLSIQLTEGWNLISGIGNNLPFGSIYDPGNILIPNTFFGFNFGYFDADIMETGKGYWIRTFEEGLITLGGERLISKDAEESFDYDYSGWIKSNNLKFYFGLNSLKEIELLCSMPPMPPEGAFDIRFDNDLRCAEDSISLYFQNMSTPLQLSFELNPGEHWLFKYENGEEIDMINRGTISIDKPIESAQLTKSQSLPESFHLYQNYPNPFNHRTVIKYNLPYPEFVTLAIYDVLGTLVTTLINNEVSEGFHQVEWNGTTATNEHATTGVYFIKFETSSYSQSRKILLLK